LYTSNILRIQEYVKYSRWWGWKKNYFYEKYVWAKQNL